MANPMMSNYPFNPPNMMYNNSYNPFNTNTNINVKNNNNTAVNNKQGLLKFILNRKLFVFFCFVISLLERVDFLLTEQLQSIK